MRRRDALCIVVLLSCVAVITLASAFELSLLASAAGSSLARLRRAERDERPAPPNWRPWLNDTLRDRAIANWGVSRRLDRLLAKLAAGEPITVAVAGGSVAAGRGSRTVVSSRAAGYVFPCVLVVLTLPSAPASNCSAYVLLATPAHAARFAGGDGALPGLPCLAPAAGVQRIRRRCSQLALRHVACGCEICRVTARRSSPDACSSVHPSAQRSPRHGDVRRSRPSAPHAGQAPQRPSAG